MAFNVSKVHQASIKAVRRYVKNVRKSTHNDIFKHAGLKKPPKDVCTRWNSTFVMIKCLFDEIDFYQSLTAKSLQLEEKHWDFVKEYVVAFEPISIATKIFQETQLVVGE